MQVWTLGHAPMIGAGLRLPGRVGELQSLLEDSLWVCRWHPLYQEEEEKEKRTPRPGDRVGHVETDKALYKRGEDKKLLLCPAASAFTSASSPLSFSLSLALPL